jgi:hypothetical protein
MRRGWLSLNLAKRKPANSHHYRRGRGAEIVEIAELKCGIRFTSAISTPLPGKELRAAFQAADGAADAQG